MPYPSINDREFNLLKKITENTADMVSEGAGNVPASSVGQIGGPAGPLDGGGKIPSSQLPPLQHDVGEAANEAAMLALDVEAPAIAIRTDFSPPHVFFLTSDPATTLSNWVDTGEFGAGAADPTAQVGPVAINGVASTYMRSDAAPVLNLSSDYSWSGRHLFISPANAATPSLGLANTNVQLELRSTNAPANQQRWNWALGTNNLVLRVLNDAGNQSSEIIYLTRSGSQAQAIRFGNDTDSPSFLWAGANAPWQVSGTNGLPGQPLTSTGNATSPAWGPVLASGNYAPTLTPGTNVASASVNGDLLWSRIGDIVTVSGSIDITASGAGPALVTFPLPVAPGGNFSDTHKLSGSGAATNGTVMSPMYLRSTSGAQTATIDWIAPSNSPHTARFQATYTIA